jgi:hypothetical protein
MVWRCFLGNHYVHVKCLEGIMIMLRVILLSALTLLVSATKAQDKSGADKAPRTIGAWADDIEGRIVGFLFLWQIS